MATKSKPHTTSHKDIRIGITPTPSSVHFKVHFKTDEFVGREAEFKILAEVEVHDSSAVNKDKTVFSRKFTIRRTALEFDIPDHSLPGFTYKGKMIDINLFYQLKIDDGVFVDTTLKGSVSHKLEVKPEISKNTKELIEPKDCFHFVKNLRAIPLHNQIITLGLCVVGLVVLVINTLIGVHDQFVPESATYFYSHVDSDGDGQSPFFNSLALSGAAGAAVWYAMRSQLRKYMKFKLKSLPAVISRETSIEMSQLVEGWARVDLKEVVLRIVACNMEKGQYVRGSGSNRRTVSFSEPVRGVLLFRKQVGHIAKRSPVQNAFPEKVDFAPMFDALYPPNMISDTHGIDVYWEIQLIHPDFVDHELVCLTKCFKTGDFYIAKG